MIARWTSGLARAQATSPVVFLLAALIAAAASLPAVLSLKLNSSWTAMLPSDRPSVRDLALTEKRVGGLNELALVISGAETPQIIAFARELVPRLEKLKQAPNSRIFAIEWNVAEYEDFVYKHRHLYATLDDLREIRDELQLRLDYERLKHNPLYVNLEDPPDSPEELIDRMKAKADAGKQKLARFPEGFYVHPDGKQLTLFVRTDISGGNAEGTETLVKNVEREVNDIAGKPPGLLVEPAGSLMAALEEHRAVKEELIASTVLTAIAVLAVVLLFFRKKRAPLLLWVGVSIPTLMTFAVARFTVHELNTSTAFLGSIVLGNGVNPHIIWLARYLEERRRGLNISHALVETHRATFVATLAVASTAALAYGSLVLTNFKGFRDFGIISSVGMFLCWAGVYTILPAITVLSERFSPITFTATASSGTIYGRAFWAVVNAAPRGSLLLGGLFTVACALFVSQAIASDPIEYDFRNLKSVREESSRVSLLNKRIAQTMPGGGEGNAIALLVDTREQAKPLRDQLVLARDTQGAPYGNVTSLDDLMPADQAKKLPVLAEIRESLLSARKYVTDPDDLQKLDENLPPDNVTVLTDADLPESVARRFTERDGARGRILFVSNQKSTPTQRAPSIWDGRYLIAWAKALRALRLPDGSRPPLAGRAPVFADMVDAVLQDGPIAVFASLITTVVLVSLAFRRTRERLATLGALLLGILWMAGTMALAGMKLNFLNFVAFPITFGNGADYAINVMQRYGAEREASPIANSSANEAASPRIDETPAQRAIRVAVQESGGAVILCSLTTVIGYSSLYVSANKALNSFGAAMAISELTCLTAAVIVLPAALWLLARKKPQRAP